MLKVFRFESIGKHSFMDIEESPEPNRFRITIRQLDGLASGLASVELTREDWEKIHQLGAWSSYGTNLYIKEEEERHGLVVNTAEGKEA